MLREQVGEFDKHRDSVKDFPREFRIVPSHSSLFGRARNKGGAGAL